MILVAILFLATGYGFLGRELWQGAQRAEAEAGRSLVSQANLLRSNTSASLRAADLLLSGLGALLSRRPDLLRAGHPDAVALLKERLGFAPHLSNLAVYGPDGRPLYDALELFDPSLDLSDRDYFRVHRDAAAAGLFIGRPVISRLDGAELIALSRRIERPGGGFAGIVATAVPTARLREELGDLRLGEGGFVGLFHVDGTPLATVGPAPGPGLPPRPGAGAVRVEDGGVGYLATRQELDGYPLYLLAARPLVGVLAEWRRQARSDLLIVLGLTLAVLVLSGLLSRQLRRREAVDLKLRQQAAILEQITDAVVVTGREGRIVDWNRGAERLLGYARGDVLGRRPRFLYRASEADAVVDRLRGRLRCDGHWAGVLVLVDSQGRERVCDSVIVPLLDESRQVTAWVSVNRDVTERQRAEQRLRESESRLRSILDNMLDAIVIIDGGGIMRWANQAAVGLFGHPLEELLGRNVSLLMPEPYRSEHDAYLRRYLATGEAHIIGIGREVEGQRRDGSRFPLELAVSESAVGGERLFTGVVRDITERKRVERMKNEFVATVSHELRTPLTSIRGSLALVTGGVVGELPPKARNLIDIAHKNSQRLVALVNDILDIQKIESGYMEFRMQPVDLGELARQALEQNQDYARQFDVRLRLEDGGHPARTVFADPARLQQVFANLLSNAVKFSPRGGEVILRLGGRDGRVRVDVADRGPGIPAGFRHRIFEKFAQADASTTRRQSGTGLGLSIARAIVERHAGRIGFDTLEGEGTTFFFELPECRESAPPAAQDDPERPRLLVCENDPAVAQLLGLMLEQAGYAVDLADSAAAAREQLRRRGYAAMTLDLNLPDQDGVGFIRELRGRPEGRGLPVVVVSVRADQECRRLDGEALGVVDWLSKPFDQERLCQAVDSALRHSPEQRARVLHVEDDPDLVQVVAALLDGVVDIDAAASLAEARDKLRGTAYQLVLLDVGLPDGSGLALLESIQAAARPPPVLVFSAQEHDAGALREVSAALVKSRTSNRQLIDTIKLLVSAWPDQPPACTENETHESPTA